jgi:cytochrome P460
VTRAGAARWTEWGLRLSLATAFLSPVATGWGPRGSPHARRRSACGGGSPGAADYYRRNKKFADGTVLVKEVFGTDHAQMTTGDAHWAKDTKVWFVLIKDSKGRYPHNPPWGDG